MKRSAVFPAVILAVAVIGGAGYWGYRSSLPVEVTETPAPPTVEVTRGDVQLTVTAPGQAVDAGETALLSRVNGRVVEIGVRPGERVETGQVLAVLGDREHFETALTDAHIRLIEAQQTLDQLNPQRMLSEAELELLNAQEELEKAQNRRSSKRYQRGSQASIEAARASYLMAESMLEFAQKEYDGMTSRPENDPGRVSALNNLASARTARDRALGNLNYLTGLPDDQEVAQADRELEIAEARVAEAEQKVSRLKDGTDPELALAQARLQNAHANLKAAQADLDNLEVTAPFDGVIVDVKVRPGQSVSGGMELLSMIDPLALEVAATVVEEDLPLVQVGQPVQLFFDALPEDEVTGEVARIVPKRVAGDRALYMVYLQLDTIPAALVSGMTVDASLIIDERRDVLRLPRSVLRARADGTAEVELWVSDHTEKRIIEVGMRGDSFVEVLSGVSEGEQVVAR
jgi:RND family efflux transporter MFP subunit